MAGAVVTTNILAIACSMGMATLREKLALVFAANREYTQLITSQKQFATVDVAVPAAIGLVNVTPDVVPPAVTAVTPTSVPVSLTQWKRAPFIIDQKAMAQIDMGIVPMELAEAAKTVANGIEDYLWSLLTAGISSYAGVAGTTPFATGFDDYLAARKLLNDNLADTDPATRFMIYDTAADANALGLRAIQDASFRGNKSESLITGEIGTILGARWLMSQRVPRHTAGTYTTGTTVTGVNAIGATVLALSGGATGTLIAGDIISLAGNAYTYNVVSSVGGSTPSSVTIAAPGLVVATAGAEAITLRASFRQNILLQKNCLAFAMAPSIEQLQVGNGPMNMPIIDEASGLSLNLQVSGQHYQTEWSLSALYGGAVIRPTLASWLAG